MNRLPTPAQWIATLLVGVVCVLPLHGFAQDDAGPIEPPTKEVFEAEVAALERVVAELDEMAKADEAVYQQARTDYRELSDTQREVRSAFQEVSQSYRQAWDQVRQRLQERAEDDAVAAVLEQARDAQSIFDEKRQAYEEQSSALDARMEATRTMQDEAYQSYRAAQNESRVQGRLLRSAHSALLSIGRAGWYTDFLVEKEKLEAELAEMKRQAEQKRAREAELAQQDEAWNKQWAKMSPPEQTEALQQLTSELELLQAKDKKFSERVDAMSVDVRALSDERSKATNEYASMVRTVSTLFRQVRELQRQVEDDPASQAKLAQAQAEYDAAVKEQNQLQKQANEAQQKLLASSNELSAIRREYQFLRDELSALSKRHHQASRGRPVGDEAKQRDRERQVIRETWELITGKAVQWGDNPFQGQSVSTIGNITNQGPNLRLYYDTSNHHAMYSMIKNERALHVFDSDGNVLFDGPVNQLPDLKDASQEIFYLWEYLANRVVYNGR